MFTIINIAEYPCSQLLTSYPILVHNYEHQGKPVESRSHNSLTLAALGTRAADARKQLGMSQSDLAKRAGWARNTLSFFERGIPRGDIGYRRITRLLNALGLSLTLTPLATPKRPTAEDLIARRNSLRGFNSPNTKQRPRK
jgi:transcriptional regulator with XRE-family HTH domain